MAELARGTTHRFIVLFYEDDAHTVPLIPIDATKYPQFDIRDPSNLSLQTGIAVLDKVGEYHVDWNVPVDAELTTDARQYRIDYYFESTTGRPITYSETFDVVESSAVADSGDLSHATIILPGKSARLHIRSSKPFTSISLEIVTAETPDVVVVSLSSANAGEYVELTTGQTPQAGKINRVIDGGYYVYLYDTDITKVTSPSSGVDQQFQILWQTTYGTLAETDYTVQSAIVISRFWLNHTAPFRLLIDKIQKKAGLPQHYTLAMLWQHLKNGLGIMNSWHPNNIVYDSHNVDTRLVWYWYICAALDAINSQQIMEVDLSFDHSGQTSQLAYDHSGNLDSVLSRMQQYLERLTEVKMALVRRNSPVGVFSGRPVRWSSYTRKVVQVSTASGSNSSGLSSLLLDLGLF